MSSVSSSVESQGSKVQATLYIDITYLAQHTHLNTGIQRVVRQVVKHLIILGAEQGFQVQPVAIGQGRFQKLTEQDLYPAATQLLPDQAHQEKEKPPFKQRVLAYFKGVYFAGRELLAALSGHHPTVKHFLFAPRHTFGLSWLIDRIWQPVRSLLGKSAPGRDEGARVGDFSQVQPGDHLLLLDSTWYCQTWPSVEAFRARGGGVTAVIYDLIPITHPQFCDAFLAQVFKQWFADALSRVDGFVCISHTVERQLRAFLAEQQPELAQHKDYDYFLLGADFKKTLQDSEPPRPLLQERLSARPTYLVVSTIEPRKNHAFILDAFEELWAQGLDVNLFFVGRSGWQVEALLDRIRQHTELNHRLHFWQDVTDSELAYCYQSAKMLIFASQAEGFGLPIIESLQQGLPVLASRLDVHREVGGEHVGYFDLDSPHLLAAQIKQIEQEGIPQDLQPDPEFQWLSWRASSEMLLAALQRQGWTAEKK
ncbi:glycosyltransferase family 1 protein [Marinospirillum sp. MEB164]|uniref:Glycosyltransferase family 1 protein n=1 Tax=Marinospirillum alkalitolerans TaxID=3123374 RepID=A0ABW8PUX6_9GAMM